MVSGAFEHMLHFGSLRRLSAEELARAVRIDPSEIKGLGPSIDALIALLTERKRKILATYETERVQEEAGHRFHKLAAGMDPPAHLRKRFEREVADEQIRDRERLWYRLSDERSPFGRKLVHLVARLGEKYLIDELASKYEFTGRTPMTIPEALDIKEELEAIDRLLAQLQEARETAQIGVIDMDQLAEFAEPGDIDQLNALNQQIQDYLREMAKRQGLEFTAEGYRLTPKAYRVFQSSLLKEVFSDLDAGRRGRHDGPIIGEGAVELPRTKQYEFGDSPAHMRDGPHHGHERLDAIRRPVHQLQADGSRARRTHPKRVPRRLPPDRRDVHLRQAPPHLGGPVALAQAGDALRVGRASAGGHVRRADQRA